MISQDSTCLLYQDIVGAKAPWYVTEVVKDEIADRITVRIEYDPEITSACPVCAQRTKLYDHRIRTLRYLDTCQYETILEVHVPRIKCKKDGVQQIPIPFAEKRSRFSFRFERVVLELLKSCPISRAAEHLRLSWDETAGIMGRAVQRGLERGRQIKPRAIGIDETSNKKRHDYVTVILDKDRDSVIDVLMDRRAETLENWLKTQKTCDLSALKSISMDMWDAYIKAIKGYLPQADRLIAFDRFHVSKHFNRAVDKVRRREHMMLLKKLGESPLTHSRFQWLTNANRTDNREGKRRKFMGITRLHLITSRAWRIKETASTLWDYLYMNVAREAWKKLLWWISHCRIPEMIQVGKTIRNYFWGILNAIRLKVTNSMAEAKNARIQRIKYMAYGFRNKERFRQAILFHLGNLDMRPSTI